MSAATTGAGRHSASLAMTMGDPAGIGPDITIKAWAARTRWQLPPFYVIGNTEALVRRSRLLGIDLTIAVSTPETAASQFAQALPVVPLDMSADAVPGEPNGANASAVIAAIRLATEHALTGRCAAIVTNPIAKRVLYDAGFIDAGHTEFLARLAGEHRGRAVQPVMMLWSPELTVVPVTIHIPLRDVANRLTADLIVSTARITASELKARFGIVRPRLAVAGLNPHAGEGGALGREELDVIGPAVATLAADGIDIRGPLPADTMFHAAARASYDAALCMYHDQALVPLKAFAFDHAVNVTLGLPFIRTSPDHGTAFDIAGTGKADASSLVAAIGLAARLAGRAPSQAA